MFAYRIGQFCQGPARPPESDLVNVAGFPSIGCGGFTLNRDQVGNFAVGFFGRGQNWAENCRGAGRVKVIPSAVFTLDRKSVV